MKKLGKLQEIEDLRTIWPNEAKDFTPWLEKEENIAILAEEIGVGISLVQTEASVGEFSVDIFGTEIGTKKGVVIENQLEKTNHDHLGKLITYAAGKNAGVIVLVVRNASDKHREAVQWLNNHTDKGIGFFLCEIKVYTIDGSLPAPKFNVIEAPTAWIRNNYSDTEMLRKEYWSRFKEFVKKNSKQFKEQFNIPKATGKHWMDFAMGCAKYHMAVCQLRRGGKLIVELYINDDKRLFEHLLSRREAIEEEVGFQLDWYELPAKKASKVAVAKEVDFDKEAELPAQFAWIAETLLKMAIPFKKHLAEIAKR